MKKWFVILLIVAGCQNNEADSPELQTETALQIGATSVVMGASINEIGPIKPMNFGILWDKQSDLSVVASANKVLLGSTDGPRKFSIKIDNLTPATVYYYRGFAANGDYSKIYYSNTISFTTLP